MRTFFATSSVSVGLKFAVAPILIFLQEEEAEVDCLRVVGGWLSTSVAMGVSRSRVPPLHFVHLAIIH